ncbi:DnaJ family domain-containing protein [Aeromicrobium sp. P5_D10]
MSANDRARHEYRWRLEKEAAASEAPVEDDPQEQVRRRLRRETSQPRWVDMQIEQAMRDGEFDNLPGAGKPIPGIDRPHDPDWWLKRLIERERLSVLPPALALRVEDAELDDVLDRESTPDGVRRVLEDFNARIIDARRQLQGGPPVITVLRDIDREIDAWRKRQRDRIAEQKRRLAELRAAETSRRPTRWRWLTAWRSTSHD